MPHDGYPELLARIAALHPSDRQWLLAQASAQTRARLTAALEAVPMGTPDNSGAIVPRAFSARDTIGSATPEHVTRALQIQPAWVATALLRMDDWPWSAALLKRAPALQRAAVGQPALALKPALAAAILKSFARALAVIEASGIPSASTRSTPFEALVQRFRKSRGEQEPGF